MSKKKTKNFILFLKYVTKVTQIEKKKHFNSGIHLLPIDLGKNPMFLYLVMLSFSY